MPRFGSWPLAGNLKDSAEGKHQSSSAVIVVPVKVAGRAATRQRNPGAQRSELAAGADQPVVPRPPAVGAAQVGEATDVTRQLQLFRRGDARIDLAVQDPDVGIEVVG